MKTHMLDLKAAKDVALADREKLVSQAKKLSAIGEFLHTELKN